MAIMLAAEQRDQVYEFLLYDLHRIDETLALRLAGADEARRLCRHYQQDLDLLFQLGWGQDTPKEVYAVTLPSDEVRAIFGRLHAKAIGIATSQSLSVVGPDIEEAAPATIPGSSFEFVRSLPITIGEHGGLSSPLPRTMQPTNFLAVRVYSRYLGRRG